MRQILLLGFFLLYVGLSSVFAQQTPSIDRHLHKGRFYFSWGYNRAYFSQSNLHFTGPNYDFTLYDLKAKDRPDPISWIYLNPGKFSIPQYNGRLGYFIGDRLHLSFGIDHMKYVVTQGQPTRISGVVTAEISEKYAGFYLNQPINLEEDLLIFEHTNGFNLVTLEFEWLQPIRYRPSNQLNLFWNSGIGGIWVATKTDVRVFGDGLDNDYHVAGFAMAGKTGPRLEWRRFFLAAEAKSGYASLPAVLIKNDAPEIGDHNLVFFEWYIIAGLYFGKSKQKK